MTADLSLLSNAALVWNRVSGSSRAKTYGKPDGFTLKH